MASQLLQLPVHSFQSHRISAGCWLFRSRAKSPDATDSFFWLRSSRRSPSASSHYGLRLVSVRVKCSAKSTEKDAEITVQDGNDDVGDGNKGIIHEDSTAADVARREFSNGSSGSQRITPSSVDSLSLGIREPVYEVFLLVWLDKFPN